MYRVVISPSANADLFNALKYIAYDHHGYPPSP